MASTGSPTPAGYQSNQKTGGLSLKIKLLQFLVTRLGTVVSGITAALVTFVLAFVATKFGIDFTQDPEMNGALLLFVNQLIWGTIQWVVKTFEIPYKKELQEILGGGIEVDGLIGPQVVARAEVVKEFAGSSAPLPSAMK